jgi:hypothetical protein
VYRTFLTLSVIFAFKKRKLYRKLNVTVPKHEQPFFVILMLKSLNILEQRGPFRKAFLYEKALKADICAVGFTLFTKTPNFSLKLFLRIDLF